MHSDELTGHAVNKRPSHQIKENPMNAETHMLFTCGIEVTLKQHLELLASPRKSNLLGIDNTEERLIYEHRHEWYGWPPIPPIDPSEEEIIG